MGALCNSFGCRTRKASSRIRVRQALSSRFEIVTITNNGSDKPRVRTAAPHGLVDPDNIGAIIVFTGTSDANYPLGEWTLGAVVDAYNFDLAEAMGNVSGGGVWALG